jgi:replicative DNA helicase
MYNNNIKNVEDVEVGDIVMGDDSSPRNVLQLCRGKSLMYRIRHKDGMGEPYVVNDRHKLVLVNINTRDIIEIKVCDYLKESEEWKNRYKIYRKAIEFNEQILLTPAYEFGKLFSLSRCVKIPYEYIYNIREARTDFLRGFYEELG